MADSNPVLFWRNKPSIAKSVIGRDDRKLVADPMSPLWRPVVALFVTYPEQSNTHLGTGVLIAPRLVLTAAHNLYDLGRRQRIMGGVVKAGLTPQGCEAQSGISAVRVPKAYEKHNLRNNNQFTVDYGLVLLKSDAVHDWAKTVWPMETNPPFSTRALRGSHLSIAGYPARNLTGYTALTTCYGPVDPNAITKNTFTYDMDTTGGQSGGPVFRFDKDTNRVALAGIHVAGFDGSHNLAHRFTADTKRNVLAWAKELTKISKQ